LAFKKEKQKQEQKKRRKGKRIGTGKRYEGGSFHRGLEGSD